MSWTKGHASADVVIYRDTTDGNHAEYIVHLGQMKKYYVPLSPPAPGFDAFDDLVSGTTLPVHDIEGSLSKSMIVAFTVESFDEHETGVGAASLTNFQHRLKLECYPAPRVVSGVMSKRYVFFLTCCSTVDGLFSILPPYGEVPFCPRGLSRGTLNGFSLYCLALFLSLSLSHRTEQPLMSAPCYWLHHL